MSHTFGEPLEAADASFAGTGGYRADAHCRARRVDLVLQAADGSETILSSAPLPEGLAVEDVAHDLLAAEIGAEAAEATCFVVTLR